jgi:hypothetical protein
LGSLPLDKPLWEFMADSSSHTELGTFVDEVTLATNGEIGEGTVYYERSGPAFMKSKSEWTITSSIRRISWSTSARKVP